MYRTIFSSRDFARDRPTGPDLGHLRHDYNFRFNSRTRRDAASWIVPSETHENERPMTRDPIPPNEFPSVVVDREFRRINSLM